MDAPIALSTFELELLLDSRCESHTSVMKCDACRAKTVRLVKLFKIHEPKGVVIKAPKLFKILFPHQDDEVLLTHVLYAYFCAVEYSTWLFGQAHLNTVNESTKYRKETEKKWLEEAKTDLMMCFAMEAIMCHRIAALNIHAAGQDIERERLEAESLNLTSAASIKEFTVVDAQKSAHAEEYRSFYLKINKA